MSHASASYGQLKEKTAAGGVYAGFGQLVMVAVTFATTPILARLLNPDDFGLVAMVAVIIGFAQLFSDAGLSMATVQREDITRQQISNLFWIACVIGVLLCLAMISLAPLLGILYDEPRVVPLGMVWSLGFLFAGLSAQPMAILRRDLRFGAITAIDVTRAVASGWFSILIAWITSSPLALVIGPLCGSVISITLAFTTSRFLPQWPQRNVGTRPLVTFGANLTGFNSLNYFSRNADNFLIGRFLGAFELGLYSKAYSLMMLPLRQLNLPLSAVAIPALSRLQNDPVRYRAAYVSIMEKLLVCAVPLCLLCLFCNKVIIFIFLGRQWEAAAPILGILAINGLTQPLANSTGWLLISQNRTGEMLKWGFVSSPAIVASFIVGIPFGLTGIAISYTLTMIVLMPFLFWFVSRKGPVAKDSFLQLLKASFVQGTAVALSLSVCKKLTSQHSDLTQLIASCFVAGVVTITYLLSSKHGRKTIRELGFAIKQAAARNRSAI